ncbi:response regulator [Actinophytocola oryzae]|uniref:LuxR family two component transcriptional regulator n=1 Tax=Actinophytocola oryzae TaxID=502181 RepID=A0A4R7W413_9PSEU|nr:response regulator transcription factor [Actinophytocola oryzae]TDV57232.1 LuxR family two component transcriptional regulator [Actinophytocola oryzae]
MSEGSVRVLVVDDQRLVREGIASLLDLQPGIDVVGTAANGREAVEQAIALTPDVVLMDVRMPEMDGVDAVAVLRGRAPDCRVVMLTTFDDEEYVLQALRAGAAGYLLKDLPAAELAEAVRLANAGVTQLDRAATLRVTAALSHQSTDALTGRETDVLRMVASGATNREIAARLYLSEGTVKNHVSRILGRLGLRDRTQAAIYARDNGLL